MPRLPLIEDLTRGQVPVGNALLVEYDPSSQWYNASATIAAGWLKTEGTVWYSTFSQPPDHIRLQLGRLGLNVEDLERDDRLRILDAYTVTLGQKSKENWSLPSLKAHDLSLEFLKQDMQESASPHVLVMADNTSVVARFNDEKAWVEFLLTRSIPARIRSRNITVRPLVSGVHSEWAYKQLEAAVDGIVDFRLDETNKVGEKARSVMRIRFMKNIDFDGRWHPLTLGENLEVKLQE